MQWAIPENSRERVNAAGRALVEGMGDKLEYADRYLDAYVVMSNWRASHQFPLNTFKINLRERAKSIDEHAFVAQRLKRAPSIIAKLSRFPNMRLTQMQDIGGCRAVLSKLNDVTQLRDALKSSRIKHRLVNEKDYITEPKRDGYRGIHLVYRYMSDRKETYNNHSVEIQIRTNLQHAWATAVETVGTLIGQGLKADRGEKIWLDFFALVSAAFAIREGVDGPHDFYELQRALREMERELHVIDRLSAFQSVMKAAIADPERRRAAYFLIKLDAPNEEVIVLSYAPNEFDTATADYKRVEEAAKPGVDAVLVVADSAHALRIAYPNYFGDTSLFIAELQNIIADV
jgi:ppGpp synthetase/RelA/SpoT-type nucleotidyltranferase